ncbi:MAG: CcmD family protein [Candidatus Bipolaricaulia bacterium]
MTSLYAAFSIVWAVFFAYNAYLMRRTNDLENEVRSLKDFLASPGNRDG